MSLILHEDNNFKLKARFYEKTIILKGYGCGFDSLKLIKSLYKIDYKTDYKTALLNFISNEKLEFYLKKLTDMDAYNVLDASIVSINYD